MRTAIVSTTITALLTIPTPTLPCTVLSLRDSNIVAKSYDWKFGHGMFITNKRDVIKTALDLVGDGNPARWTSIYGSITINQYGREFPVSGMNEAGLIVEVAVGQAQYATGNERPSVNELQWVQYQLDKYATVAEVIDHIDEIRIAPVSTRLHYYVADRSGERAVIEFIDGHSVTHSSLQGNMQIPAITNNTYQSSVQFARGHEGFGGEATIPAGTASLSRFVRAALYAENAPATVDSAFTALRSLRFENGFTQWNIVYKDDVIHFGSALTNFQIKTVEVNQFDFSCESPVRVLDVNSANFGAIEEYFMDYTSISNQKIVRDAGFDGILLYTIAGYPDSTNCSM